MKFHTKNDSYFEVREVHSNLYRIFYCSQEYKGLSEYKTRSEMISSQETHKKACKLAQHFQRMYDKGYYDAMGNCY